MASYTIRFTEAEEQQILAYLASAAATRPSSLRLSGDSPMSLQAFVDAAIAVQLFLVHAWAAQQPGAPAPVMEFPTDA